MRHGASPDWSTGLAGGPASGLISTHLVTLICCLQVSALQRLRSSRLGRRARTISQEPTLPSGSYRAVFFIASLPNAGAVEFRSTKPRPTDVGLRRIGCAAAGP